MSSFLCETWIDLEMGEPMVLIGREYEHKCKEQKLSQAHSSVGAAFLNVGVNVYSKLV